MTPELQRDIDATAYRLDRWQIVAPFAELGLIYAHGPAADAACAALKALPVPTDPTS